MAANSVSLPATRILTEALRHLKYLILEELTERCSEALSPDSISWILTVPAIWNKSTRNLIKEIAIEVSNVQHKVLITCTYVFSYYTVSLQYNNIYYNAIIFRPEWVVWKIRN